MSTETPDINTNVRLFDLVRYSRAELHEDGLITDEEYGWLCATSPMATSPKGGSPSRQRLEDYDELRAKLTTLETRLQQSEAGNAAMRDALEKWQHVWKETDCEEDDCASASRKADEVLESTTAGADLLAELQSLRERLAEAEGERDEARAYVETLNRLEEQIIGLAPQDCRQNSFGASDILEKFAAEYRKLQQENHMLRHGHLKP